MQATEELQAETTAGRRPLEGLALLEAVADAVFHGADPARVARKFGLPYNAALGLHAEAWTQVCRRIEDVRGPEYLRQQKLMIERDLEAGIAICREEMVETRSSRPLSRMTAAVKTLNAMRGNDAPTLNVHAEMKLGALYQPEVMGRLLGSEDGRRALALIERVCGDGEPPAEVIDVTRPAWADPEPGEAA